MYSAVNTRVSPGYMRSSNFDIEMAKYYMCFSIKRIICYYVLIYVRLVTGAWAGPCKGLGFAVQGFGSRQLQQAWLRKDARTAVPSIKILIS